MMRVSTKILLSALLFSLSICQYGCWNSRELETLGVVVGVGIDAVEGNGLILTSQVLNPKALSQSSGGGGSDSKPVWIAEGKGESAFEAIRNSTLNTSRRLYWPHNKVIIISRDTAKLGVQPYSDFFLRDAETRPNVWVAVSKYSAAKVIRTPNELEKIPMIALDKMFKDYGSTSEIIPVQLMDFANSMMSETTAPVAPEIDIKKDRFEFIGTAVFHGDKLVGELNLKETRGLLWVLGKVKSAIIVLHQHGQDIASLEVIDASGKVRPIVEGSHIRMNVDIDVLAEVGQIQVPRELTTPDELLVLERLHNKAVCGEINKAIVAAKRLNADIFGFGDIISKRYPYDYNILKDKWDTLFREIDVKVKVNTQIRYVGHTAKTLIPK